MATLAEALAARTAEAAAELVEETPKGIRCLACGHRCVVPDGRHGACYVRFNRGGTLHVPHGYVAGLQDDPIEKKPFFHVLPGARALSFGMLGCDYKCGFCFPGETMVATDRGVFPIGRLFDGCETVRRVPGGEVGFPKNLRVPTRNGSYRKVRKVFRHTHRDGLIELHPYYLPPLRATPNHGLFVTETPGETPPKKIPAGHLTKGHYLVVPKRFRFSSNAPLDVTETLASHFATRKASYLFRDEEIAELERARAAGATSRTLAAKHGIRPDSLRHILSRARRGLRKKSFPIRAIVEDGRVRFSGERRGGIPTRLPCDERLAALFGYYCAEGSVVRLRNRPNSFSLNFSLSPDEADLANEITKLLGDVLGVSAHRTRRPTTLGIHTGKTSVSVFFRETAGVGAEGKRVPAFLFNAPRPVVEAFLDAYVRGDGHRYPNGKVTATTVSRELAWGVAWLALRVGRFPSLYVKKVPRQGRVEGRKVRRAPRQYTLVWYEKPLRRKLKEDADFYYVPLRSVKRIPYDGPVYNLEVETEHNYFAGLFLVSNCQNWITSQALRDPNAVAPPKDISPEEIVAIAKRRKCRVITSTYNEPLITSEWSQEVFRVAKAEGLLTSYVSNGNATEEVLDFIRPQTDLYKIDFKAWKQKAYSAMGGSVETVKKAIRRVYEKGFHLEIVTLIVPGISDDPDDLKRMAEHIASVSPEIPWHLTAFHSDYKMSDTPSTSPDALLAAYEIAKEAGLSFVYCGNRPGMVGGTENTYCPGCGALLVRRFHFRVLENRMRESFCPDCNRKIPGIWEGAPRTESDGLVRPVM